MTTVAASPAGLSMRAGWLLMGGIVLASLTEAIAGTVLSLGRGDIMGDTYATPDAFAWLDVGYTAFKLIGFAFAPWILARIQPRTALLAATLVMGAACALASATTQIDLLILLRAIQGLAGAILLVGGQVILFLAYPRPSQPLVQAIFAMGAVVAPATLAPMLHGWFLDNQSWTWIFFSVLPLSLAAAGLMLMSDLLASVEVESPRFDWIGFALLSMALFFVTYVLSQGSRWNWFEESRIVWLSLAGGTCLLLFIVQQRRVGGGTLFDLTVFRTDDFTFAFVVSFVAGAALFGSAYLIPAFAVSVLGFTPTDAGQLLLPSGALFAGALLLAAWLMQGRGLSPIATVPFGILLIMAAMWMLSGSSGESGAGDMMPAVLLRGLGLGFLFLSITLIAFNALPRAILASGIALFNIGRQLGGLIGVAGLQTAIDQQVAASQTVLGSALNPGAPAVAERLASTVSLLAGRGMDPGSTARAAAAMLGRAVRSEATVIAFDTAFMLVALLFVAAAPLIVGLKIALKRRRQRLDMAGAGA